MNHEDSKTRRDMGTQSLEDSKGAREPEVPKFYIGEDCPACADAGRSGAVWVEDNGDGSFYDGDACYCDTCEWRGGITVYEDGDWNIQDNLPDGGLAE